MTDAELGMELFVVVGNALNLLLRGVVAEAWQACGLEHAVVERLDETLAHVQPAGMRAALGGLSANDRQALAACCRCAMRLAGTRTDALLGAPESLVEQLARTIET